MGRKRPADRRRPATPLAPAVLTQLNAPGYWTHRLYRNWDPTSFADFIAEVAVLKIDDGNYMRHIVRMLIQDLKVLSTGNAAKSGRKAAILMAKNLAPKAAGRQTLSDHINTPTFKTMAELAQQRLLAVKEGVGYMATKQALEWRDAQAASVAPMQVEEEEEEEDEFPDFEDSQDNMTEDEALEGSATPDPSTTALPSPAIIPATQPAVEYAFASSYRSLQMALLTSPTAEVQQLGRHAMEKVPWSIFQAATLQSLGYAAPHEVLLPTTTVVKFNTQMVEGVLKECACHNLALNSLQILLAKDGPLDQDLARGPFVETLTVAAAISAVATYFPRGTRGPGSHPSENHIKGELWGPILSNAVKLAPRHEFAPLWEMDHLFPQTAGAGSSRSDFAALKIAFDDEPLPFLITEFEANGVRVHKDHVVAAAEATLQMNSVVARFCERPADLEKVRCFVGLASDATIYFRMLSPEIDTGSGRIYYRETDCDRPFRLAQPNLGDSLLDALRLIAFIRGPILEAGRALSTLLTSAGRTVPVYAHLVPSLPDSVAKGRASTKDNFTPLKQRTTHD
ncbi:hypothetical protein DFS34DRAFT_172437 [Phlyctochytrium arcticum]|nr:hypothetical protein DFS34DRAFT_172437 [Phlyctochytrium arcticum]